MLVQICSEWCGLSDVAKLRFSSGSDVCGRRLHEVSCGSDWYSGVVSVMARICVASAHVVQC